MNLIELHILQSFPVSCLNRDDLNSPKSAVFGGCKRARISSQCLKRAQRLLFREYAPGYAQGERTKLIASAIAECLEKETELPPHSETLPEQLAEMWGKLEDKKKDSHDLKKSKTLTYLSPGEIESMVSAALNHMRRNPNCKAIDLEKVVKDTMKGELRKDAADIALFGRMVASNATLTLEGAALFSHALSCHKSEPEMDFYAAVDDLQPKEETGAGMTGVLEFNSACFYRYIGINLDLLRQNLQGVSDEEIRAILQAFIRAALLAVPTARHNSMNAATLPSYVIGLKRSTGHPLQLVNAFETPVRSRDGYVTAAIEALKGELEKMQKTWGIEYDVRTDLPQDNLSTFITKLTDLG